MSAPESSSAPQGRVQGIIARFRAELAREGLRGWTATFQDRDLETAYQRHLINVELQTTRMIVCGGVTVWFLFSILDVLTVKENLEGILIIRWLIAGPIAILWIVLMFLDRFKRFYSLITALGMFAAALSLVGMIALMPDVGAPPYVIGILVTFAYASCFFRVQFRLAGFVYIATATAYAVMMVIGARFDSIDMVAGLFFMVAIVGIALVTHYAQELRSRQIWQRDRQQALDAAYIEELLIEATAADQSKLNFMSILSHELRTPLHQIIGFSEVIKQQLDVRQMAEPSQFADQIRTSAHDLLGQIGKVLRYADATAGKITYEPETTPVVEIVEAALSPSRSPASARGVSFELSGIEDAKLKMDFVNTSYALGHLIENAIKASERDSQIVIRGRIEPDGAYTLEVQDFGAGMDEAAIKAAFEPFSQVEQVRTRSRDGLGLGLTLARKIFTDQNAELSIESELDKGTTAIIKFPETSHIQKSAA